jgi:hypothetical protein
MGRIDERQKKTDGRRSKWMEEKRLLQSRTEKGRRQRYYFFIWGSGCRPLNDQRF